MESLVGAFIGATTTLVSKGYVVQHVDLRISTERGIELRCQIYFVIIVKVEEMHDE
jgi:hypothetical protein